MSAAGRWTTRGGEGCSRSTSFLQLNLRSLELIASLFSPYCPTFFAKRKQRRWNEIEAQSEFPFQGFGRPKCPLKKPYLAEWEPLKWREEEKGEGRHSKFTQVGPPCIYRESTKNVLIKYCCCISRGSLSFTRKFWISPTFHKVLWHVDFPLY